MKIALYIILVALFIAFILSILSKDMEYAILFYLIMWNAETKVNKYD